MKLQFNDPLLVSESASSLSDLDKDRLQIRLVEADFFIDPISSKPLDIESVKLDVPVPKQVPAAFVETMEALVASSESAVKTVVPGTIVANVLLGVGLKKLWTAISILQFITYTKLWKISPPANLEMFFG